MLYWWSTKSCDKPKKLTKLLLFVVYYKFVNDLHIMLKKIRGMHICTPLHPINDATA